MDRYNTYMQIYISDADQHIEFVCSTHTKNNFFADNYVALDFLKFCACAEHNCLFLLYKNVLVLILSAPHQHQHIYEHKNALLLAFLVKNIEKTTNLDH